MSRLTGVGARLGLALLVVLAAAMAFVYLLVVPSLRNRLIDSRVSQLERAAPGLARELPADRFHWPDFLETASESANARVVVYDYVAPPSALVVVGDSRTTGSADVERDPLALRAAQTLTLASGTVSRGADRYAEAATPVPGTHSVLLVGSPLHETLATVALVRNRLLVAGALALAGALAVGYVGAWLFARRLRRLEAAAERIAAGNFEQPIRDAGTDEVGQLARAFDRMRERLSTLDHARREFIANASHELRTPLFTLGGFLELLSDEDLDEATHAEFLATMREQVDRLAKLAGELLDLSRADAGRLQVEREPVDLASVAEAVADEFAPVARSSGRTVELDVADGPQALADEQRVIQVVRVLLENALVHTPVDARVTIRAGDSFLAVEDEGPGIPPEHLDRVFDRFYRLEGRTASGSGLGLAIARELARAMGGSLEVESRPGRTVFTLWLERDEEPEQLPPEAAVRPPRDVVGTVNAPDPDPRLQ